VVSSPAVEATDAPQPLRHIVQPYEEDEAEDDQIFFIFPSNGAPVE
jgi:hypothetical protein